MAQIIKHRRGSLESVSAATKRSGELLVVTGSAGITATNSDALLFIGVDGSTVTAANKFLQGTSVPDLSGASYDTSVDGIPFYDTNANKLYILNKGGNVEVKATANTDGTGIVSSSAQIDGLGFLQVNGDAVVSGSSQITLQSTTGYASLTASIDNDNAAQDARLDSIESFTASLNDDYATDAELAAATGALENTISNLDTDDIAEGSNLYFTDARVKTKLNAEGVVSGSSQITLSSVTGYDANEHIDHSTVSISAGNGLSGGGDITATRTLSLDTTSATFTSGVKTKLDAETVISGSSQVQIGDVTGFTAYSSSVDSRTTALEDAVGAGSNIDGRLTALETFSGSQEDKDSALATYTASVDVSLDALNTYSASLKDAISVSGQNLTVIGNLEVQGTTTTVDSTTITLGDNIIELNGSGAANGGLLVKDVTAPNTVSGSLLWDSTNDYWKAGALGSEIKLLRENGDSVVSGSAQITLTSADNTGFDTSYVAEDSSALYYTDARVKTKLNAEAVVSSSAQISAYNDFLEINGMDVVSGSVQVTISDTTGYTSFSSSLASTDAAQDARLGSIETYTASLDATFEAKASASHTLISSSAQVVSFIDGQDVNLGGISGSSLDITGNTKIDGNLVLGGNITIGDASSDTISFGGDVASDIIPSANNTYDLGSSTDKFAEIHSTNFYGTINGVVNATNGVISSSAQLTTTFDARYLNTNGDDVVSGSSQIVSLLSNQATDFGTGRVSADNFGNADGTSTFTGSFVGDGSGLTGLATNLSISGDSGTDTVDLLNDTLSITGGTAISAAITDNTITINASDASTSAKGIASFSATNFSVASGNVSIKSGGVAASHLNADVAGTGISLNGVDNSIEVDYGSTAGTAVEGNTSLTVQGTSNEIEISGGSVTLGAGGTVTIGLPDSVTIATASIQDDLTVGGNVEITGNLSVLGTTTTVNSTTVELGDNIIELNGTGAANGGLLVKDTTAPNVQSGSLLWDGTNDYWKGGALGSEKEFARFNADPTVNTIQKVDSNGLLVDSVLTDDGTDATFSGDVIVDGFGTLTNGGFLYTDANNTLQAVAPANAGDLVQWNGSSFIASNEVDGGTF